MPPSSFQNLDMAWTPLARRKNGIDVARSWLAKGADFAQASTGLLERARESGVLSTPLVLALRAANKLAASLAKQPNAALTAEQRRALNNAAARIRALASHIIVSTDANRPNTVEYELAELIRRTLALVERVAREPDAIETTAVAAEPSLREPD